MAAITEITKNTGINLSITAGQNSLRNLINCYGVNYHLHSTTHFAGPRTNKNSDTLSSASSPVFMVSKI